MYYQNSISAPVPALHVWAGSLCLDSCYSRLKPSCASAWQVHVHTALLVQTRLRIEEGNWKHRHCPQGCWLVKQEEEIHKQLGLLHPSPLRGKHPAQWLAALSHKLLSPCNGRFCQRLRNSVPEVTYEAQVKCSWDNSQDEQTSSWTLSAFLHLPIILMLKTCDFLVSLYKTPSLTGQNSKDSPASSKCC